MKYVCNKCKVEISSNINERFIAKDGRCLCSKCSEGIEPISERELQIIKEYQNK